MSYKKVKCIIIDNDNTLVLTERLAFEVCTDLANEILENHGIKERYRVDKLLEDFVGHNFRGMMVELQKKRKFTMTQDELDDYTDRELETVTKKLRQEATLCDGVQAELEKIEQQGCPMAVVTTSAKPRVVAGLEKCGIDHYFPNEHVFSAATSLDPPSSKPDPAIYLHACKVLGVKPEETVTVEDSRSGGTSAMRAGVPLIGYVGVYKLEDGEEKMRQMAKLLTEQCGAKAIMYQCSEFKE